jgi:hypothetical protein
MVGASPLIEESKIAPDVTVVTQEPMYAPLAVRVLGSRGHSDAKSADQNAMLKRSPESAG